MMIRFLTAMGLVLVAIAALATVGESHHGIDIESVPPVVSWNALWNFIGACGAVAVTLIGYLINKGLTTLQSTIDRLVDRQDEHDERLREVAEQVSFLYGAAGQPNGGRASLKPK